MDARKKEGNDFGRRKTNSRSRSFGIVEKKKNGKFARRRAGRTAIPVMSCSGLIVAESFRENLRRILPARVSLAPLKMNHTIVFSKRKKTKSRIARSATQRKRPLKERSERNFRDAGGRRHLFPISRSRKWDDALRNHNWLSEKEFQPALTPEKTPQTARAPLPKEPNDDNLHPGKPVAYGFAVPLSVSGTPAMWHTGSTMGFRTGDRAIHRWQRLEP